MARAVVRGLPQEGGAGTRGKVASRKGGGRRKKKEELCECGWLSRLMDNATSRRKAIAVHVKAAHCSELRTSLSREEQEAAQLRHEVATLQVRDAKQRLDDLKTCRGLWPQSSSLSATVTCGVHDSQNAQGNRKFEAAPSACCRYKLEPKLENARQWGMSGLRHEQVGDACHQS